MPCKFCLARAEDEGEGDGEGRVEEVNSIKEAGIDEGMRMEGKEVRRSQARGISELGDIVVAGRGEDSKREQCDV